MLKSFFVLANRNFYKNGAYSIINILGLSVGLAAFIMLSLFVRHEYSYDTYHDNHERIYRVEQMVRTKNNYTSWNQLPAQTSVVLEERFAEIEDAISFHEVWGEYLSTSKKRTFHVDNGYYANPDIFDFLTINFLKGNKSTALDAPLKIVLTESVAKKLFPDSDPMGQSITVDSKRTYQVSAIIEDFPFNSNARMTYIIPFSTYKHVYNEDFFDHWDWHGTKIYVKLKEGVDFKAFDNKIKYLLDEFLKNRDDELYLKPIWKVHLQQGTEDGMWTAILLYGTVGLFTLLLAAMNFINLTTAYSLTRTKEIGVKKVLGSSKLQLMQQFLGEALIIVFISLLVALTITEAALPIFNQVVSVPLDLKYIEDWPFTLFIIGIATITGVLSGLYPSLVLSSLNPILCIKNQLLKGNKFKKFSMRKGLVVFQLFLSIMFVLSALGMMEQFKFLQNKDLGFNKENLFITSIKESEKVKINEFTALRNEIIEIPGVIETSLSITTPFHNSYGISVNWEGCQAGEKLSCRYNKASNNYLNTMEIEIIAGSDFDLNRNYDPTACIVNETFVKSIGWSPEEAIGKRIWDNHYIIKGVLKDFHERTPYIKIQPYVLIQHRGNLTDPKILMFRLKENYHPKSVERINSVLHDYFPESNFHVRAYDPNALNQTNAIYLGMTKTFGFFSVVSILIAIIGLFALVSFSSKRKVKEIGIRKVLGATSKQIFSVIIKGYIKLILIANIIAIPLGILSANGDPSHYKAEINYWQFFWVALISILITLLTVGIQVIKVSRANPVDSLRYE